MSTAAKDGLHAGLELAVGTVRPGEELAYAVVNTGSVDLTCGLRYLL